MTPPPGLLDRLRSGTTVFGGWSSLPGTGPVEILAGAGLDYVVVDLQHGAATEADLAGMLAAVSLAGAAPLVRPRRNDLTDIGRVLDLGAHGVVVPNVDSAEDAARAVAACSYPPRGRRSYGPLRPGPDQRACIVQVESAAAVEAAAAILTVDGVAGVYVGPFDLALSLGCTPGDTDDPVLVEALTRVLTAADVAGVPCGVHAWTGPGARRWAARGCRLVTVVADAPALGVAASQALAAARADLGSASSE